jgi:hypothetical protein
LNTKLYSGIDVEGIVKDVKKSFSRSDLVKPLRRGAAGDNFQYHPRIRAR